MRFQKHFVRTLFFIFLLACLLTGLAGTMRVAVQAAPKEANALDVVINEVAWGGTAASANDEWIELYNNTGSDIDLSSWSLIATDGTPNISLSGIIPAGGYFLLERTDDTTVSDITADLIYTGALGDGGEILELRDDLGNLIDTANSNAGGWPAGNSTTKATMERIDLTTDVDSNWADNNGTVTNGLDANGVPLSATPKQSNSTTFAEEVIISEVAWAGTQAFSGDEWIELYNPGPSSIVLDGWRLEAADGDPSIALTGTLAAGGFLVLERGDQNVITDVNSPESIFYNSG